jgi:hypothetical protein
MSYIDFINAKKHSEGNHGIAPVWIPDSMFDFQSYITDHLIRKGRCAAFLDTGTGKSFIELVVAVNYVRSTNKRVLLLTPLAVAFQFLKEAEKFGIDDIEYSKNGKYKSKIVCCNYERLHLFSPDDFDCVILDESSILKNFDGVIKQQITSFIKRVKYRYLFTATPSPNDFIELGTSSEALGYLGYTDMLTKFFTNNEDTVSPMNIGTEWILKGHARKDFFKWVSGWSISMRKPSDLANPATGLPFDDSRHILPELITHYRPVVNESNLTVSGQMTMFAAQARRQSEVQFENKQTISDRCERAVELANEHETSVYWCNLNPEGDLLEKMDGNAKQIKGSMKLEQKEDLLLAFSNGEIKKLITKPKMTAFGLNWQHCNHTTYFPTWSYEQYYQAIRRFWRFGQKSAVTCDLVYSDGQKRVLDSLIAKAAKANELFNELNSTLNQSLQITNREFSQPIQKPSFL